MSFTQYQYYEFDCVVLDKPNLRYTDPFFLKIYINSCLSYDTAFICGIEVEPSKDDMLIISTCSKRTYADDIIKHLRCLAYLLNARIAVAKTYTLYENTVLDPIVVYPRIEHVCLFRECHINAIKVEPLLDANSLLRRPTQLALTSNIASKTSFTNLMRFIRHFNMTEQYVLYAFQHEEVQIIDCDTLDFSNMLLAYISSNNEDVQSTTFKEAWNFIKQRFDRTAPLAYPLSCPLLKDNSDKLEELKLLQCINEDLFKQEFDKLVDHMMQNLEQQRIARFKI